MGRLDGDDELNQLHRLRTKQIHRWAAPSHVVLLQLIISALSTPAKEEEPATGDRSEYRDGGMDRFPQPSASREEKGTERRLSVSASIFYRRLWDSSSLRPLPSHPL